MKLEESSVEYDTRTKSIMSQSEEGICVVEFRDSDGNVIHFEVRVITIVELMPSLPRKKYFTYKAGWLYVFSRKN